MKKILWLTLSSFLLIFFSHGQDWQEVKSKHFIVYFQDDKEFAEKTLGRAEIYYDKIADELAYARYSNFWTWANRVKIYIYPGQKSFHKYTNQADWSKGSADYNDKTISSFAGSSAFLDQILPHELTHLIFRDYIGFEGQAPLWLDEGVAMWQEKGKRRQARAIMKTLVGKGNFINLEKLTRMDTRRAEDKRVVQTFYIESVSLVGFLIEKYGSRNFVDFCRQLKAGKSIDEALSFSYPNSIKDLADLEKKWLDYIREQ